MRKRPLCMVCTVLITTQIFLLVAGIRKMVPVTELFKAFEGKQVNVSGQIYRKEKSSNGQILYLKDAYIQYRNHKLEKIKITVYDKEKKNLALGNQVFVGGTLRFFDIPRNFGNFNQKFYYEKQEISMSVFSAKLRVLSGKVWKIRNQLSIFREKCYQIVHNALGEEKGGMISAILLGEKREVNPKWKELYQVNGIGHILAISGLHLSFIGTLFYSGLRKIGISCKVAGGLVGIFLVLYTIMTGAGVSTLRALLMFVVKIGADITGRVYDLSTSLSVTAAIIISWRPQYFFDAGFLLSFGAVFGIILLKPILEMLFSCGKKWMEPIYFSLAIQLFLLPITLYFFFEVPTYALFLNMIVIPLMPFLLGLAFFGVAISFFCQSFGMWMLKGSSFFLMLYNHLCERIIELPNPRIVLGRPEGWQVVCCYLLLFLFVLHMKRKEKVEKRYRKILFFFSIFLVVIPQHFSKGQLEITMLDVGQGDGIFLRGPLGTTYLIDGGSSDVKNVGKYRIEPFLKAKGVEKLDYIFISHGDLDHLSGIDEMLERQKRGVIIENLVLPTKVVWDKTLTKLANKALHYGTRVFILEQGEKMTEGEMKLECVFPGNNYEGKVGNASSMVLSLQYREFDILFTGDVEGEGEDKLQDAIRTTYDVLKVAHHGSKYSTKEEFLNKVWVKIGLISSGRKNSYGHPHKELLQRLKKDNIKVYGTKENGSVTIKTDGKEMELECYLFSLQKK